MQWRTGQWLAEAKIQRGGSGSRGAGPVLNLDHAVVTQVYTCDRITQS